MLKVHFSCAKQNDYILMSNNVPMVRSAAAVARWGWITLGTGLEPLILLHVDGLVERYGWAGASTDKDVSM